MSQITRGFSVLLSERKSSFKEVAGKKILPPEELEEKSQSWKTEGKSIVTLNGSFDLLHPGHLEMIYQASCQADLLLMLLNTDDSIRSYKSPKRPINPLEVRLQHIAALEMVDYVSWFDETDPCAALEKIKPHVHANGSEYGEDCIESEVVKRHGGKIYIIELIEGYSSTNLIKKIHNLCD